MTQPRPKSPPPSPPPPTDASSSDDQLDLVFAALSHRVRRGMLDQLAQSPAKISDLAAPLTMSLPAASKHVRVLERAGLVRREVDGRVHRCHFERAPLDDAHAWIRERREFWTDALQALEKHVSRDVKAATEPAAKQDAPNAPGHAKGDKE